MEEIKMLYMVVVYNKFGVLDMFTTMDPVELHTRIKEESAKGRKCKVAEREISTAASK